MRLRNDGRLEVVKGVESGYCLFARDKNGGD
jgi:hypothetical protein